jgi:AcrR family transcriptional regulator
MAIRRENLTEAILAAAKSVFLEHGFHRVSMDLVAAKAGTTKQTIYARFPSKDALFEAVLELVQSYFEDDIGDVEDLPDAARAVARFLLRVRESCVSAHATAYLRLAIAEAKTLGKSSERVRAAIFDAPIVQIEAFLSRRELAYEADDVARLFAALVYPDVIRSLFDANAQVAHAAPDEKYATGLAARILATAKG